MKELHSLVGMKYAKTEKLVAGMPKGAPLTVVREPSNHVDRLALAVYDEAGTKLGFIKAGPDQQQLARLLDMNNKTRISGRLVAGAEQWAQVEIDV
jgi:hypothetical protein